MLDLAGDCALAGDCDRALVEILGFLGEAILEIDGGLPGDLMGDFCLVGELALEGDGSRSAAICLLGLRAFFGEEGFAIVSAALDPTGVVLLVNDTCLAGEEAFLGDATIGGTGG